MPSLLILVVTIRTLYHADDATGASLSAVYEKAKLDMALQHGVSLEPNAFSGNYSNNVIRIV